MTKFPVNNATQQQLEEKMTSLGIYEKDLQESYIRSSGSGGQNVNKVSTCVVLVHTLTGISVKCQKERSRAMNRFWARRVLVEKVEEKLHKKKSEKAKAIAKIRRQKRKRSKRAKDKMLDAKRKQSEKKHLRKRPTLSE